MAAKSKQLLSVHETFTVKIENLSKDTEKASLWGKLVQYGDHIGSIRIINCPSSPANFAYVNCSNSDTADSIINSVNKKILLDYNLLMAKLKGGTRRAGCQSGNAAECTVKVLIYDHLSGEDLDQYFTRYGKLFRPSVIRFGRPNYAYVNFGEPCSAQEARKGKGSHNINGVTVTACNHVHTTAKHPTSDVGHPTPAIGYPTAAMGHPTSAIGHPTPGIGCSTPLLGHPAPGLGHPIPGYPTPIPGFGHPIAALGNFNPTEGRWIPAVRHPTSPVRYPIGMRYPIPMRYPPAAMRYLVPHPTSLVVHSDSALVNVSYPCNIPLALHYVKEEVYQYIRDIKNSQVKVTIERDAVCLCAEKRLTDKIGHFINNSISNHEAKINCIEETLSCCYLPVLADKLVQDKFAKIQVPYEMEILAGGGYVSLERLAHVYSKCDLKTVEKLKEYMHEKESNELPHYKWYWQDILALKAYDKPVSEKLEQAFLSGLTIIESIGQFEYKIDPSNMEQMNMRTKKVRKIKRTAIHSSRKWFISLQIRAHDNHLHEIKREVLEEMEKAIVETKFTEPYEDIPECMDSLLEIARHGFISAEKAAGSGCAIVLKGTHDMVKSTELRLKEEILTKKLEAATVKTSVGTPDYWEPQDGNCELKVIHKGTAEWTLIEQHMTESGFCIRIIRVERIQNLWLWEVFDRSRKRMSDKNSGRVNEKQLFHGTRTTPPRKIYNSEQGFDNRVSSRGLWGVGAYFAVKAKYSNKYAHTTHEGHKQMFLAHVITGITCEMSTRDSSLTAPPCKAKYQSSFGHTLKHSMFEDERYDSVSGKASGSEVFIIYEHGKVYPAYLITYQHVYSI